ncbi:PUR family DNA/RNA-binding protein [Candidatus Caldipriscus sp.]|jgi:hypothetical protein|nr:PUR family DNA/RNA-binding protein [Candidatus Caldipriscus sp.]
MEQRKDDSLFSKRVKAGRRIYFIDIKKNKKGDLYLSISEKRKEKDGSVKRTRVIVFEEDVMKFEDAFNEVVVDLKKRLNKNGK